MTYSPVGGIRTGRPKTSFGDMLSALAQAAGPGGIGFGKDGNGLILQPVRPESQR